MSEIKSVEDLRVYKESLEILDKLYKVAYKIPHIKLRTQMINSSEAIPALIAEGFAKKRNPKESARFYEIAMGESDETIVHLKKAIILSRRLRYIPIKDCEYLVEKYRGISKQLNRLNRIWRSYS